MEGSQEMKILECLYNAGSSTLTTDQIADETSAPKDHIDRMLALAENMPFNGHQVLLVGKHIYEKRNRWFLASSGHCLMENFDLWAPVFWELVRSCRSGPFHSLPGFPRLPEKVYGATSGLE